MWRGDGRRGIRSTAMTLDFGINTGFVEELYAQYLENPAAVEPGWRTYFEERLAHTPGRPLVTRTSYWATLQPGTAGYRVFAKQMANVPSDCRLHQRARPRPRAH